MGTYRSWQQHSFEGMLTEGIASAKAGERSTAQAFLHKASKLNPMDARPWVWLSATTDDPTERRAFLEQALAIDPANMAARRGLAVLEGYLGQDEAIPTGKARAGMPPAAEPLAATSRTFRCAACAGQVRYDPQAAQQRCEHCGTVQEVTQARAISERHERSLERVLPTADAQRWASATHALSCSQCGASSVLPGTHLTTTCAFCGADHLIVSPQTADVLVPQGLLAMGMEEAGARQRLRDWARGSPFTPRDLAPAVERMALRPVYVPAWSFDTTVCARWTAQVKVGEDRWERREGEKILFFNDLLVPGTRALSADTLRAVQPFDLGSLLLFDERLLAGWPALLPDRSLADASIGARGEMARRVQGEVEVRVLAEKEARDIKVIPISHTDQTYRSLLLPLWVGTLTYRGKTFPVYVNGQSGAVCGQKPRDTGRVALALIAAVVVLLLLASALLWTLSG